MHVVWLLVAYKLVGGDQAVVNPSTSEVIGVVVPLNPREERVVLGVYSSKLECIGDTQKPTGNGFSRDHQPECIEKAVSDADPVPAPGAPTPEAGLNTQQQKMRTCAADAMSKGLQGDERKTFMGNCLSSSGTEAGINAQQQKMKNCNAGAISKGLKGDDRKAFMISCLSSS
jgi:hypothetical protein